MDEKLLKRALACLFLLLYVPYLYQQGYQRIFQSPGDFPTLYWGAKLAFEERRSPYVEGVFDEIAQRQNRRVFPYLYPPPSLLLFYPFTAVSYDAAKVWLLAASHVCLLVILYLFFRIAPFDPSPRWRWLPAALMTVFGLSYHPVADNFAWGQINLIVLALVCFSWLALKRGGHALGIALPLSLAILLKTYPVLLLPLLVIRKRYAAAGGVVGLLALYALAAWLVLPQSLWGDWARNVLPTGGYGLQPFGLSFLPVEPWNHSINGFMLFVQHRAPTLLGLPTRWLTRPLTYLFAGTVAAATVGLAYLSARRGLGAKTLDVEVALFLLMMFLVAPLSWEHHLVYALPAALFAIDFLLRGRARAPIAAAVVAALFVLAWDFPRDEMFGMKGPPALLNTIKFLAAFGLWVFVAKETWEGLRGGVEAASAEGEV